VLLNFVVVVSSREVTGSRGKWTTEEDESAAEEEVEPEGGDSLKFLCGLVWSLLTRSPDRNGAHTFRGLKK
jgi:hypothetical protein